MKRNELPAKVTEWQANYKKLLEVRQKLKELTDEKGKLDANDGYFWGNLKLLAQEIAQEHAEELCGERGWQYDPLYIRVIAVPDDEITESSLKIIYSISVSTHVTIRYHYKTNAIIQEELKEDAE